MQKVGFPHHCAGHFIQEVCHEIETYEGKKSKNGFMVEADIPTFFQTLEEAEAWCRERPQMQKPRTFGKDRR